MTRGQRIIHTGINYVVAPAITIDRNTVFKFQNLLEQSNVQINSANYGETNFSLTRQSNFPLEIKMFNNNPQSGQIVLLMPHPEYSIELIEEESDRIFESINNVWTLKGKQLISSDATLRILFDSHFPNSFVEIWEKRLKQDPNELKIFDKPVLGGGVRLVIPPTVPGPDEPTIEIKIESFLNDTKKLFVETQFIWQRASIIDGSGINGSERISKVYHFVEDKILKYLEMNLSI